MKFTFLIAAAALLCGAPALAQTGVAAGAVVGTTTANQHSNSQFNGSNSSTFTGRGGTTGSSASGFNTTLEARDGFAAFASNGAAGSSTVVTPFSVATTSDHSGFTGGIAGGGGTFKASTQTFGQSNGDSAFSINQDARSSFTENKSAYAAGTVGFGAFGAFAF